MPGSIPKARYAKPPKFPFKKMELIGNFIENIKVFGVPDHENFATVDLYEEQNLVQVLTCLSSTGRKVGQKCYRFLKKKTEKKTCIVLKMNFHSKQINSASVNELWQLPDLL